jgi:hypothetical protein
MVTAGHISWLPTDHDRRRSDATRQPEWTSDDQTHAAADFAAEDPSFILNSRDGRSSALAKNVTHWPGGLPPARVLESLGSCGCRVPSMYVGDLLQSLGQKRTGIPRGWEVTAA